MGNVLHVFLLQRGMCGEQFTLYDIPIHRWSVFVHCVEKVKNAVGSKSGIHLGGGQYVQTDNNSQIVLFTQCQADNVGGYNTDQCLSLKQFDIIIHNIDCIENALPELHIIVPCYVNDDHNTQEGRMLCQECTPTDDKYLSL